VIAQNVEQHCGFGSALPHEEPHITPGSNLPPVWEPLGWQKLGVELHGAEKRTSISYKAFFIRFWEERQYKPRTTRQLGP